ncbi:MAG: sulfotransferase domain-containing protein, partial [Verrucomicrobiota bacterium]
VEPFSLDLFVLDDDQYAAKQYEAFWLKQSVRDKVNLMSHENYLRPHSRESMLQRISALQEHFNVRIFVTIREQFRAIWSRYCHDVTIAFCRNALLKDVLALGERVQCRWPLCIHKEYTGPCYCQPEHIKAISLAYYDYHDLYQALLRYFDEDNIRFFAFEAMKKDNDGFIKSVMDFVDPSGRAGAMTYTLPEKKINARSDRELQQLKERNADSMEEIKVRIKARYAESNQSLNRALNLGLEEFGYPLPDPA